MKRKQQNQSTLTPEQIHARKAQAVLKQYADNKLRKEDTFTPFEREVLIGAGIIKDDEPKEQSPQTPPIQNVRTQLELAGMLERHFHGQMRCEIVQQLLSDWKLGKRLPKGAPLPPTKEGAVHNGKKWVQWMEDFIICDPKFGVKANGSAPIEMDVHDRAYLAKSEATIFEKEIKRIEFEKMQARYVRVETARDTRRGALKLMHVTWRRRLENNNTKLRAEWLEKKLTPDDLLNFKEFDLRLEKATVDFVEQDYKRIASQDQEKEQAKQLADESVKT